MGKHADTLAGYDEDIAAWATEQARLIRARQFDRLDIEHIADEIDDVGKSEKRELASRMAVLLVHLLKWQFQPDRRGSRWEVSIRHQREGLALALKVTPSLKTVLRDPDWRREAWLDGIARAAQETGLDEATFPDICPWDMAGEVMRDGWLPS
jgi:hypothetical protein